MERVCDGCTHGHPICGCNVTLECRKHAPQLIGQRTMFPVVRAKDTCGDWKSKSESDETKPYSALEKK